MAIATSSTSGGYENKFVNVPPDTLVCKLCIHPCRDPYLSGCCGHNFCKSCLDIAMRTDTTCPFCRINVFTTFPNKLSDREIRSLHVMCTNKESGCEWQGELNDINNHLGNSDGCQFEDVKCSNECGKELQRQYLTSHVETECPYRKVDCQYCHITGEHQFMEGEHKEQCPKLPLPCPNKCEVGSVPREDMEAHRKECPLEIVQCEYQNVGCEEWMIHKRKREHDQEKMEEHLSLTKRRLTDTQQELADTKSQLSNAVELMNALMVTLHQATGQTSPRNAAATVSVAQWWVRLTALTTMFNSGDQACPVTMNITEFTRKKEKSVTWYSNSFFTHDMGYKVCLKVCATGNGDGKGTHMSVFLYLMKGPHDDELTWPLRETFEVKVLNQISDCEHYLVTLVYDDKCKDDTAGRVIDGDRSRGWGHHKFISNEDLYKVTPTCQYLKDDCIFLQVSKL
ncbi:TNF receptor-associated factor 4-like [Dysidea avara]|uniref:TNF receptor-associated factor 4-like n=1 Tax=Dysidea avara TaxID=196820 RepID=UPI0033185215